MSNAYRCDATYMPHGKPHEGYEGWSLNLIPDADAYGTTAAMAAGAETTGFTQMAAQGDLELVTSGASGASGTIVLVSGISTGGYKVHQYITVGGTTGTAVTGTIKLRYFENAFVQSTGYPLAATGCVLTFRTSGDTAITVLKNGQMWTALGQHFTGHLTSYITMFHAGLLDNPTDNVWFDLRWYPNDARCVKSTDTTEGYYILARQMCHGLIADTGLAPYSPAPLVFPQPLRCPAGGWISIWATGGAASSDAFCMLQGFDIDEGGAGGTIA
jgi:hypothetical protein